MPITIKPTQLKYKDPSTSQYVSVVAAAEGGSSNVDVQINGTSIVEDGVANIPVADVDTLGTVKVRKADGYYGVGMTGSGILTTFPATDAQVAIGTEAYRPLNPKRQHIATFFGLSKAAGVDLAQVSVNLGEYPDAAKTAIQSMLAVPSSNNPIFAGAFSQNRKSNTTVGTNSFSSGDNCEASAEDSHAEGRYTVASGHYSHAEGNYTTASGMASHAAGTVTIANHASQYTFGEYNVEDSSSASALSRGNYVEIVGNGTASNAKSNARALDWNGNEYLNGYIYVGCNNSSTNGTRIPHDIQINGTSIVNNGVANIPIGSTTTPGVFIRGYGLYQDGAKLGVNGSTSENIKGGTAGTFTPVSKQHEATFYGLAKAAGDSTQSASSNAVGVYTDNAKTAIQNMLSVASSANPVFTGSISLGRKAETTVGEWSVAIGQAAEANYACTFAFGAQATASSYGAFATGVNAVASGYAAHAEGMYTIASGSYAHAEGVNTTASDQMAHAEGTGTNATGVASHAEGQSTLAFQFASHAQGMYTIASGPASHVFGRYNIADSYASWPEWVAGTSYSVNDKVKRTTVENEETTYLGYVCATANSDTTFNPVHWSPPVIMNYVEIVGNGESQSTRSNARALDWNGNQYLKGNLYVGCNADSTGGIRVPHDIQINGTSIVSNGIANIPQASTTNIGVIKTDPWFGTAIMSDSGKIYINAASDSDIKTATQMYKPISPSSQHISVFYGLAKAAGDTTQAASSNAVGVYTSNAKAAIQNMLSIPSSNDPVFTGSFSQNRKANTTVGSVSAVIGYDNAAEGDGAIAMGYNNRAYSQGSIALGTNNDIYGDSAVTIGYKNIAQYQGSFVFGQYNSIDTITDWAPNVEYDVGDLVYNNAYVLKCLTAHTSESTIDYSKWRMTINNLFTLGNGNGENARSNALAVNFDGDLRIKGNLYVNCNADSSGGIRIPHDIQINGTSIVSNGIATVPIASDATFGVIKTREFTDGFKFDSNNNFQLAGAADTQIKAGSTNFRAITPYVQHYSVFYGLATAAGDATQSASDNAVGTYTDGAKTAIQNMLAVAPTSNPVFTDSISMGRLENSTVGYNSVVLGYENSAISTGSISIGYQSIAAQELAVAEGYGIIANSFASHVFGRFNAYDGYDRDPWVAGTSYALDDIVVKDYKVYTCQQANSDTEWDESKWYNATQTSLLQVGYGADDSYRRNVLNLDVSGNLFLGGNVYVGSNLTCTSGNKVATVAQLPTVMTGATASENGTSGLVPTPTPNDMYKFLAGDGTYRSGGLPMVILSYGNSTWADFIEAYNNHVIVYCRASSNANPKTGSQTRMAFMAYVNNETTPTNVEFQYYRSMSSHSGTQMGDQVYVYKLDKTSGWSVTVREAGLKEIEIDASTGLKATWSNNKLTITTI